jgi:hypothetical protein
MKNKMEIFLVDFDDTLAIKDMDHTQTSNPFIFSKCIEITNSSGQPTEEYYYIHQSSLTTLHLLSALNIQVIPLSQRIDYDGLHEYRKKKKCIPCLMKPAAQIEISVNR